MRHSEVYDVTTPRILSVPEVVCRGRQGGDLHEKWTSIISRVNFCCLWLKPIEFVFSLTNVSLGYYSSELVAPVFYPSSTHSDASTSTLVPDPDRVPVKQHPGRRPSGGDSDGGDSGTDRHKTSNYYFTYIFKIPIFNGTVT